MKTHIIRIDGIGELPRAAAEFAEAAKGYTVFAFEGEMGAGKTTFINALAQHLGAEGEATSSPTFAIVNEYMTSAGRPLYHFDLYRLNSLEEALDAGLTDYIDSGDLCFIEWPEVARPLLPDDTVEVAVEAPTATSRVITLRLPE